MRPKEAPQAKKGASHHDRAPAPAGKPEVRRLRHCQCLPQFAVNYAVQILSANNCVQSEQKLLAVFAKAEEVIKAPPAEPRPQPAAAEVRNSCKPWLL